jgi:hypothetical protein
MPIDFGFMDNEEPKTKVGYASGVKEQDGVKKPIVEDLLPAKSPLDLEVAKAKFADAMEKVRGMKSEVEALEVVDEKTAAEMTAKLGQAKTLRDSLETKRKEVIKDTDGFTRAVNSFVKGPRDIIDAMLNVGKRRLGNHAHLMELKRREEQRKIEEAQRKEQERLDKIAKEKKVAPVVIETPVIQPKTGPIRTETGKSSTRYVWVGELEDITKVPAEHLLLNMKTINAAIGAGIRNIPGVKIYEKPITSISKV